MHPLNKTLARLNIPDRIKRLPRDHRGFPIPWFVYTEAGQPDFRVIGPGKMVRAVKLKLCWVCGETLARHKASVLGPMCTITRTISEPPSHRSCAMFSARACPFLTQPRMRRNEIDLPEERIAAAGLPIMDNPGLVAVWISREYPMLIPVETGLLFRVGEPEEVRWIARGEPATREEVVATLKRRLPILIDVAREEGDDAMRALMQQIARARQYLPPAVKDVRHGVSPEHAAARGTEQLSGAPRARDQDQPAAIPRRDAGAA